MAAIRIALTSVRLAMRTKAAMFFTFVFPLLFLFAYAGIFARGNPQAVAYLFGPVVVLQVMGSAFWGLGLQSVMRREQGSLRRYRLAPIGAGTMVGSSLIANFLLLIPTVALLVVCAMVVFHMPLEISIRDLAILVAVGAFAFAGFGLTVASVANTMQEAQIYNNMVWFPLLFLSGATFPLAMFPQWLQRVALFLPATYLVSAFQGVMSHADTLSAHWAELVALTVSGTFGLLFAWKLFRWEKEEKMKRSNKLLAVTFVVPFLLIGAWMNARGNPGSAWDAAFKMMSGGDSSAKASGSKTGGPATAVPAPPGSESGLVSDFDEGTPTAKFGSGWTVSTDSVMGGKSTAEMKVVDGGTEGSKGSLAVTGQVFAGAPYPWAGAMFYPGAQQFAPVNLSSKKEISFWAKGDGKTDRVMIFTKSLGYVPATQTFVAGSEWKQYSFPLTAFQGTDGHDLEAVLFSASTDPGTFAFQIDDVRFK
ncbi:MAG TPA: CIA30 family protein [Terriglobia bacterium]|nr:CIA30 family protein [Terriglobia bacterium]